MEYKVLIKLYVPEIEETYEVYIPVNLHVGEVSNLLCELVNDLSKIYPLKNNIHLCNRRTGKIYNKTDIVLKTDIRNGTELIIF